MDKEPPYNEKSNNSSEPRQKDGFVRFLFLWVGVHGGWNVSRSWPISGSLISGCKRSRSLNIVDLYGCSSWTGGHTFGIQKPRIYNAFLLYKFEAKMKVNEYICLFRILETVYRHLQIVDFPTVVSSLRPLPCILIDI